MNNNINDFPNNGNQSNGMNNNFNGNNFPNNNPQNNMNNNFGGDNFPNNGNQPNGMNNNFNGNNFSNDNPQNNINNNFNGNNFQNNMNEAPQPINSTPMNNQNSKGGNGIVKYIIIGIVALVVIAIIAKVLGGSLGGGKNTTGQSGYSGSDVAFTCKGETQGQTALTKETIDFVFNYKSGSSVYQLKQYGKIVLESDQKITDAKYKEIIGKLNAAECSLSNKCTASHLELGITTLGWDTTVDRKTNTVEITYYNLIGKGITASSSEMKQVKAQYEAQGYHCS